MVYLFSFLELYQISRGEKMDTPNQLLIIFGLLFLLFLGNFSIGFLAIVLVQYFCKYSHDFQSTLCSIFLMLFFGYLFSFEIVYFDSILLSWRIITYLCGIIIGYVIAEFCLSKDNHREDYL